MDIGAPGVVGGDAATGIIDQNMAAQAAEGGSNSSAAAKAQAAAQAHAMTGQGAQFIYAAATVANILCDNMTQTQINLLANFLSVVTTCVYAVLTVENPTEIIEA